MKKIKVVRIITRLNIGGPAIHVVLLNKALNNSEFCSHLIIGRCSKEEGDMAFFAREKGISMTIVPELGRRIKWRSDLIALWKLFKMIKKERPHIVHTHTAKAGTLGRIAAIFAGVPIKIHTFHGHIFHSYFSPIKTKVFLFIERIFARFTERIIVVGDTVKEEICNRFKIVDKTKISVIELGLDRGRFKDVNKMRGNLRNELNVDEKTLLVGIVGRLASVKNHRLFLNAVRLLKEEIPDLNARFLIIGDGELRGDLEDYLATLGIKDLVHFTGWRNDMLKIYADLDIVVLCSSNEGTPLSLIEAMASQKAVVATAVGGVPDLIKNKETGLLVQSNDPTQLKQAILTLIKDEGLRRKMTQAGSEYVYSVYSKERLVSDIEDLYKTLLVEKKIIKTKYGKE